MKKSLNISYSAVQGSYWMYFGAIMSFASVFLLSKNYTNSEIGDTKLGLSASKYFEESIPFNSVKFKNFDVIYTKKNLDPRIFLFYDSMTGNTERFVKKVAKVLIEDLKNVST